MPSFIRITQGRWGGVPVEFRPGRVIVRVREWVSDPDVENVLVGFAQKFLGVPAANAADAIVSLVDHWAVLQGPVPLNVPAVASLLLQDNRVAWAEPDLIVVGFHPAGPSTPSWAETAVGVKYGKSLATTDSGVLIGVADCGIRMTSPGTAAQAIEHSALPSGRLLLGYDYVDNDTVPAETVQNHGTGVTGIVVADPVTTTLQTGNEWITVQGVNDGSPVYISRVLDDGNNGSQSDVFRAVMDTVDLARANRAKCVINLSLGFPTDLSGPVEAGVVNTFLELCEKIGSKDTILVCAVGNEGETANPNIRYPAAYAEQFNDRVVAVGATTNQAYNFRGTAPAGTSEWILVTACYGEAMTLVAPGDEVPALADNDDFRRQTGTSFAAPFVTGLISLLWCMRPDFTPAEVIEAAKSGAWKPAGVDDKYWGAGRIDMKAAVANALV